MSRLTIFAAVLCGAMFAAAFVAAPWSCEWGLTVYTILGIAVTASLLIMPFVLHAGASVIGRFGRSLGWATASCGVWLLGMFVANVRIICKMF